MEDVVTIALTKVEEVLAATMMVLREDGVETTALTGGAEVDVGVEVVAEELEALLIEATAGAEAAAEEEEATTAPTISGILESSALLLPVLAMISAGQATCSNSTVGLSAPSNQSYRQSQPG